jgi:hypothetical protein
LRLAQWREGSSYQSQGLKSRTLVSIDSPLRRHDRKRTTKNRSFLWRTHCRSRKVTVWLLPYP